MPKNSGAAYLRQFPSAVLYASLRQSAARSIFLRTRRRAATQSSNYSLTILAMGAAKLSNQQTAQRSSFVRIASGDHRSPDRDRISVVI
jgi:hypothetical protein